MTRFEGVLSGNVAIIPYIPYMNIWNSTHFHTHQDLGNRTKNYSLSVSPFSDYQRPHLVPELVIWGSNKSRLITKAKCMGFKNSSILVRDHSITPQKQQAFVPSLLISP